MEEVKDTIKVNGKIIDYPQVVRRAIEDADKMYLQYYIIIQKNGKERLEYVNQVKIPFKNIDDNLKAELQRWVSENMEKFVEHYNEKGLKDLKIIDGRT